jgi:hypothetical protein
MRSEIGKIELDNTFSEREEINDAVVKAVDEASDPWGIKVTRYEIRDITPTETILKAMEQQVEAEREKRAEILKSEGERESRINLSKGEREEAINLSRGERQRRINEAEGRAHAIEVVSTATAEGIVQVAKSIQLPKGKQAVSLRIGEQFVARLGEVFEQAETQVLPFDIAHIKSIFDTVTGKGGEPGKSSAPGSGGGRPPGGERQPGGPPGTGPGGGRPGTPRGRRSPGAPRDDIRLAGDEWGSRSGGGAS